MSIRIFSGPFSLQKQQIRMVNFVLYFGFVHCAAHRLNLALSSALSISSVRNSLGVIKDVINLFRNNALAGRPDILLKIIFQSRYVPESKRTHLVGLCKNIAS